MAQQGSSRVAIVIGGGIGGLTAAAALHLRGWRVTVLERAASLAPAGAAISLAPNALRALDVIGVGDEIRDLAAWQGTAVCAPLAAAGCPAPTRRRPPPVSADLWCCCTGPP